MKPIADEKMIKDALGDEAEEMSRPPNTKAPESHPLWPKIRAALCEIFDPEIPVNIFELGLIYQVDIKEDGSAYVQMTLTAPGCPVAGEMPGWVEEAVKSVEGVTLVTVDLVWDPPWSPAMMAETAKLQLNMF